MKIVVLLALIACEVFGTKLNPLSDDFINYINSKQNKWVAGRNFEENTPIEEIRKLLGARRSDPSLLPTRKLVRHEYVDVPKSFDAREHWPECKEIIGTIADQSHCGSCWAVAAASAMTDRRCIASKGKLQVPVSALDLLSCCRADFTDGCHGGTLLDAWNYWYETGIVTGGAYESSEGCRPYSLEPCEHYTNGTRKQCSELKYDNPACNQKCADVTVSYKNELTFAAKKPYTIYGHEDFENEILANGPLEVTFDVYADFLNYKSGIYEYTAGKYVDGHAVRIIGWGVENDTKYWLVANSWNEDWGENGYFKILRGHNEVQIESSTVVAVPKI